MAEDEDVDAAEEEAPAEEGNPSDVTVVEDAEDADAARDADEPSDAALVPGVLLLAGALEGCIKEELPTVDAMDVPLPAAEPEPLSTDDDPTREDVDPAWELPGDAAPDDVELVPAAPELPPPGATGVPQPNSSTVNNPKPMRGFTCPPIP
jgi:hypothetical protein